MPRKNIIQIEDIHKSYGNYKALENINIKVKKGSIFGLLGPNGAGKTSLIRIINQIIAPDKGTIKINGNILEKKHVYQIGYLPEERGLYKKMKVGEQAIYLAQLKGLNKLEAKKRVKFWLEKFNIENWWNKKIEDLSKGMAQKVQFITTILHEPELLILDEPFSGLDPTNSELIKKEILDLKKAKSTIILSTHNMNSVEEICDEAAIINKSKKILDGKINELKNEYSTNRWKICYVGNKMSFTNAVWGGWKLESHYSLDNGTHVAEIELLEQLKISDFVKGIVGHVEIQEVIKKTPSMQDVFLNVVNNE